MNFVAVLMVNIFKEESGSHTTTVIQRTLRFVPCRDSTPDRWRQWRWGHGCRAATVHTKRHRESVSVNRVNSKRMPCSYSTHKETKNPSVCEPVLCTEQLPNGCRAATQKDSTNPSVWAHFVHRATPKRMPCSYTKRPNKSVSVNPFCAPRQLPNGCHVATQRDTTNPSKWTRFVHRAQCAEETQAVEWASKVAFDLSYFGCK